MSAPQRSTRAMNDRDRFQVRQDGELVHLEAADVLAYLNGSTQRGLRFTGNRSMSFTSVTVAGTPGTRGTSVNVRQPLSFVSGVSEIIFEFYGVYDNNGNEVPIPNAVTITGAVGQSSTILAQVTFNGSATGTLQPGGVLRSDPIPIYAFGTPAAPLSYFVNWYAAVTGTQSIPAGTYYQNSAYPGCKLSTTTTETDQTMNASYAFTANPAESNFGHNAAFCRPIGVKTPAWMSWGDSIMWGLTAPLTLGRGWFGLMIDGLVPYGNGGEPSNSEQHVAGFASRILMWKARYADAVLREMQTNDFGGGRTLAQYQADWCTVTQKLQALGVRFQLDTTCTPQSTSSGNVWLADSDQTPQAAWLAGGAAQLSNAWKRDGLPLTGDPINGYTAAATGATGNGIMRCGKIVNGVYVPGDAGHPIMGVLDVAAITESPTKVGAWAPASDGTSATRQTSDGIHPYTTGVNLLSAGLLANWTLYNAYVAARI